MRIAKMKQNPYPARRMHVQPLLDHVKETPALESSKSSIKDVVTHKKDDEVMDSGSTESETVFSTSKQSPSGLYTAVSRLRPLSDISVNSDSSTPQKRRPATEIRSERNTYSRRLWNRWRSKFPRQLDFQNKYAMLFSWKSLLFHWYHSADTVNFPFIFDCGNKQISDSTHM